MLSALPIDSFCPVYTSRVFHNFRRASQGFLFHFLAPAEQTFHLSIFQWNAGTNIHTDSHALTDVHTQAGVRNMKWFSAANCEIHLNRLFSQLCDRRQYLGPDWAAHLKKKNSLRERYTLRECFILQCFIMVAETATSKEVACFVVVADALFPLHWLSIAM